MEYRTEVESFTIEAINRSTPEGGRRVHSTECILDVQADSELIASKLNYRFGTSIFGEEVYDCDAVSELVALVEKQRTKL
jgi:hypothetical protein